MLLAEIHGKRLDAARDNEDYLTSAVFGHLRYVPLAYFWTAFLAAAKSLPDEAGREVSLGHTLEAGGLSPAGYERLEVRFWRKHSRLGEPDLLLLFSGGPQRPLVVLVEAKLWAEKGGSGDRDQLVRYLGVLDDLDAAKVMVPSEAGRYLVYLTPRESLAEVEASAALVPEPQRDRLFRVQWQDVLVAADAARRSAPEPARTALADVAAFLRTLGLEYFGGFGREALADLPDDFGAFYRPGTTGFRGFGREPDLTMIGIQKGSWA